jgi:hypothetical protein
MSDEELRAALYAACLASARAMGPALKTMSWFGRNVPGTKATTP